MMIAVYVTIAVAAALLAAAALVCAPLLLDARRARVRAENEETARRAAEYAVSGTAPESEGPKLGMLERRLTEAGIGTPANAFAGETALMALAAALILGYLTSSIAGVLIGIVAVAAAQAARVELMRSKRTSRFEKQLSDALPMVAENLRSGNGAAQSLTAVAEYMPDPLRGEFSRAAGEMGFGMPFTQAMDNMYERVPCNDLRLLNGVIAVNAESGGDLSGTLDGIAETMQRRAQMRGHISSITASGRLSAGLIVALPWLILAVLWLISPAYIQPLVDAGWLGAGIIGAVAVMDAIGYVLVRKTCSIRFD